MMHADTALARRIEWAEALNARGCTAMHPWAASLEAVGGIAVFAGADSPLTHAIGIGLSGPVTEAEICDIEAFFRTRGARPSIDLCPLAHLSLLEFLGARGYRATQFDNVMVK